MSKLPLTVQNAEIEMPKDICPLCANGPAPVRQYQSDDDTQVVVTYCCPDCGHAWTCSWLLSALPVNGCE